MNERQCARWPVRLDVYFLPKVGVGAQHCFRDVRYDTSVPIYMYEYVYVGCGASCIFPQINLVKIDPVFIEATIAADRGGDARREMARSQHGAARY